MVPSFVLQPEPKVTKKKKKKHTIQKKNFVTGTPIQMRLTEPYSFESVETGIAPGANHRLRSAAKANNLKYHSCQRQRQRCSNRHRRCHSESVPPRKVKRKYHRNRPKPSYLAVAATSRRRGRIDSCFIVQVQHREEHTVAFLTMVGCKFIATAKIRRC